MFLKHNIVFQKYIDIYLKNFQIYSQVLVYIENFELGVRVEIIVNP